MDKKAAISVRAADIDGMILSSMESAIGNVPVDEPPFSSMSLNHKIPSLEILTFHYTRTQSWNQAHNRSRLSPIQHRLILSQKG
jgi:hypothetical protein